MIAEWELEGRGKIVCEPSGIVNVNRYLPITAEVARLGRLFHLARDREVEFAFGFSDYLILRLDGQSVFEGENSFKGFANRVERGYVEPGQYTAKEELSAGAHVLAAELRVSEPFGWGLHVAARGLALQPIDLTAPAP